MENGRALISIEDVTKVYRMNILGALDVPTSGTYILAGQNVGRMRQDKLSEVRNRKIGFVFQSFNLLPPQRVVRRRAATCGHRERPGQRAEPDLADEPTGNLDSYLARRSWASSRG